MTECPWCKDKWKYDVLYEAHAEPDGIRLKSVAIAFCPVCGRKLPEDDWWKEEKVAKI